MDLKINETIQIPYMVHDVKIIVDPLQNQVVTGQTLTWANHNSADSIPYEVMENIIQRPDYIIADREAKDFYYFKKVDPGMNVLLITRNMASVYYIAKCVINPNAEYIAGILGKGVLTSYDY